MESLGHCIRQAVDNGLWEPFQLVRGGLLVSLLLFADDLILYAKATMAQAELIDKTLYDFVSNGESIRFWHDQWNPQLAALIHYRHSHAEVHDDLLIRDVSDTSSWDWELLSELLVPEAIPYLYNIPAPSPLAGLDRCFWSCDMNGKFTVKSTYIKLSESAWDIKESK
ncbi:hypothetical protein V6N12_007255 [Hibiscus sabdariffa]|uniref:Reverse transcriptase domain-containing protein n=1 Tax=Hibiscus sabdariffa TaxID=183260 RepID=A0ABR2F177_9ROSI